MNRRALGIAIVVAILGMFLMLLYQQRFEQEASGGERISILQLSKQLERGANITEDSLTVRRVPVAYVEDRAVKESEKSKVVGLPVANMVKAQQTLFWTDVVKDQDERRDLSQLVLSGYRGVSIRVSRESSNLTLIQPGDYVDVIGVLGQASGDSKTAVVLLQKILVLAAGDSTVALQRDEKGQPVGSVDSITLSLTLSEAQVVALASERGRLSVVIRPPSDSQTQVGVPDMRSDDLLKVVRTQPRGGGAPVAQPAGPTDVSGKQ